MDDIIVFGDLHETPRALEIILDEAHKLGIKSALNLGDEGLTHPTDPGSWVYDIYQLLLQWVRKGNELVCCPGNETGEVIAELEKYYQGYGNYLDNPDKLYHKGNIIAGHEEYSIKKKFGDFIDSYNGEEPLLIFHGHVHFMGVSHQFRGIKEENMVGYLKERMKEFPLESGKVYWVSPGAQWYHVPGYNQAANFAIYSPSEQKVTLRSIIFCQQSGKRMD